MNNLLNILQWDNLSEISGKINDLLTNGDTLHPVVEVSHVENATFNPLLKPYLGQSIVMLGNCTG